MSAEPSQQPCAQVRRNYQSPGLAPMGHDTSSHKHGNEISQTAGQNASYEYAALSTAVSGYPCLI